MIALSTEDPGADVVAAMAALLAPGGRYLGCSDVLAVLAGVPGARIRDLASLPLGATGQTLVALRYFLVNGPTWLRYFGWQNALERQLPDAAVRIAELTADIERAKASLGMVEDERVAVHNAALESVADLLEPRAGRSAEGLRLLAAIARDPALAVALRARLRAAAPVLHRDRPRAADLLHLATQDLSRSPPTCVGEGALRYVLVADKGEMGVRAVREAVAFGAIPVVLHSARDDANALQVRLAAKHGGFSIALEGSFRESYANPAQMAERIRATFRKRFGEHAERELATAALYPGYGPLAESTAAIECFRRNGIVFVGPPQDVVERAGDKRKFRLLAQSIDPRAVVPGIVINATDAVEILAAILAGHRAGEFTFPGRLKAANGGGGRGQAVVASADGLEAAVHKVIGEIAANGWDPGVMFEANIPKTMHLEVQVLADRYGNTLHFGMRDCSEQRASQKIQEEAPPALLRDEPALVDRICALAVRIAEAVGYVGACTVELMYKDGHCYLLEMNTRIQVEHPVTEQAHRIRTPAGLVPLDLVALQLVIASGAPLPFTQSDVVCTHVAREFRINAETWRADLKDARDGERGLFLPNAGVFDTISVPRADEVREDLVASGVRGIKELDVRFDTGFAAKDKLVNKDPTFAKLIVAIAAEPDHEAQRYELLRQASIAVLRRLVITGREVNPTGAVIRGSKFSTNIADHLRVLESEMMRRHALGPVPERHVNWVVEMLRTGEADRVPRE